MREGGSRRRLTRARRREPQYEIVVDPDMPSDDLRQQLYAGNLVVLTRLQALSDFVEYTREELAGLFRPHDPEHAHEHIDPAEMAKILGAWKPRFIHSERSRKLVRAIISEAGFPAEETHYDLPKPRTSFPAGHLTTGVAFAFPWHRDAWYSAPAQQINWWLPVFPVREDNAMGFDLASFDRAVPNSSDASTTTGTTPPGGPRPTQVTREVQARPGATGPQAGPGDWSYCPRPARSCCSPAPSCTPSIPNTSGRARFSVDFRTVSVPDLMAGRGAPLVDVHCTGTAIRDFINVADESSFDEQTVINLFGAPPPGAVLVFGAPDTTPS